MIAIRLIPLHWERLYAMVRLLSMQYGHWWSNIHVSWWTGKMFINRLHTFVKTRRLPWRCAIEIRHLCLDLLLSVLWRCRDGDRGVRFAGVIIIIKVI